MLDGRERGTEMTDRLAWVRWSLYESLNYRLRTAVGGRFASQCRPISIILLLTENCNAKCLHCDIWKNRFKEDLTLEDWKKVLTDLRQWIGRAHVLISGGEALMKPFTVDLVRHAHDRDIMPLNVERFAQFFPLARRIGDTVNQDEHLFCRTTVGHQQ